MKVIKGKAAMRGTPKYVGDVYEALEYLGVLVFRTTSFCSEPRAVIARRPERARWQFPKASGDYPTLWPLPCYAVSPALSLRGVPPGTTWQSPGEFDDALALGPLALRGLEDCFVASGTRSSQ